MASDRKTLTIRLAPPLYRTVRDLARRRRKSVNGLVEEALLREIKTEAERRLYDAFGLLGEDADSDVEYALPAQREVVLGKEGRRRGRRLRAR